MQALKLLSQQLSKIWGQLDLNHRVIIILSGVLVLTGLGVLVYLSSRPSFALLHDHLDLAEAGKIITELDQMKIPYQAKAGGTSIYIPQDKVYTMRMHLATKGMPKSGGIGFEIFDKQVFGMSDFVQQVNYMRALEGELGRTIAKFNGVESAFVKVVKPESRLLVDPLKKASASVFVTLRGNMQLEQSTVNAIRFLVANSVEGLKPNAVSVVDSDGNSFGTSEDGSLASLTSGQLDLRRSVERYLAEKVRTMLDGFLGPQKAVVTVSAEINNETLTKTDEVYDPKNFAPRTENIRKEDTDSTSPQPGGVPGTTTNTSTETNAPAFTVMTNRVAKNDKTTEYAISLSRTNLTRLAGNLSRVSAAVWVDTNDNPLFATNAAPAQIEMTRTNLIAAVANALGVELGTDLTDLSELHTVKVNFVRFNRKHTEDIEQKLDKEQRKEQYMNAGRWALYGVLGLAAVIGFWRLVRSSSEELLPTGIPVGQLVGGQLVYEAPMGVPGMALPTGVAQAVAEQQRVEEILPEESEVEDLQAAKTKMVMDFGLEQASPDRMTIDVLKQFIRENPGKMSSAARQWLTRKKQEMEV